MAVVTLNNGQIVKLVVYGAYELIRNRVQSIVVVPNSKGHVTYEYYKQLTYIVTPSTMAKVIVEKYFQGQMNLSFLVTTDDDGSYMMLDIPDKKVSYDNNGLITVLMPTSLSSDNAKSIALKVEDAFEGGSDYVTTFTPIDYVIGYSYPQY
jgi:hypothetical protein